MQAHHTPEMRELLARFEEHVVVEVDGLGPVRICHGSPRSDEECVTPETPEARVREFSEGVDERVIVTAHVHIQFDREVAGIRSVNAGSVGLPYEGRPGAYWALLGPDVEHRRTEYDVEAAVERYRSDGLSRGRGARRDDADPSRAARGHRPRRASHLRRLEAPHRVDPRRRGVGRPRRARRPVPERRSRPALALGGPHGPAGR